MLNQLVDFGKARRGEEANDALKKESVEIDIVIDSKGNYLSFNKFEKVETITEAISAKKGKARLLIDKADEVLGLDDKKHSLYLEKLLLYKNIPSIDPVLLFYSKENQNGLSKAKEDILKNLDEKEVKGNFAFRLTGENIRINEGTDVIEAIIKQFNLSQSNKTSKDGRLCSICGTSDFPITSEPHGMISKVPDGQTSGSALVSYNEKAYESYGFEKNENSSICSACARNYIEGLKFLLSDGVAVTKEDSKGKKYNTFNYSHRKKLGSDTALVFWTKSGNEIEELNYLEDPEDFRIMIDAAVMGKGNVVKKLDTDRFYSLILSGAAARIAIRNWIEASTNDVRANIIEWFHDIRLNIFDFDLKEIKPVYYSINKLSESLAVHKDNKPDYDDIYIGRAGDFLWKAALLNRPIPKSLLDRVLRRIRAEQGNVKPQRVALIKLILNRGGYNMKESCDFENVTSAYISGRIFAVLENIQTAALGDNLNAPIKDRFFSSASTNPSSAFGRLFKMSNNHLSKLKGDKPGYAVNLEKKLGELISHINEFPTIFTLEEQGQFAIGYYHQRQENFTKKEINKGENNE